jgi:hypothetical protein
LLTQFAKGQGQGGGDEDVTGFGAIEQHESGEGSEAFHFLIAHVA